MRNLVFVIASLLLTIQGCTCDYDRHAIRESIEYQMRTYPESTVKDLYKNFFQDAFGPGHLVGESDDARAEMSAYLMSECSAAKNEENMCPPFELTGWQGQFYRVNLSVINNGDVPFDVFLDAFVKSAESFSLPDMKEWKKEWRVILSEIKKTTPGLAHLEEDSKEIAELLSRGQYTSHHSEEYGSAYHPHYRLIEKSIFRERILPLVSE